MELKNKRYKYFQKFCHDLGCDETELAKIIESMKVGQGVRFPQKDEKTIILEDKKTHIDGTLYTLGLYGKDNTLLRKSPVFAAKPKRGNRSIAQVQAVLMLIALAVVGAAVALSFGSEITGNVIGSDLSCHTTQKDIYKTGEQRAYVVVSVLNTGSISGDVTIMILDDEATPHVAELGLLQGGQKLQQKISLDANMTAGERYMLQTNIQSGGSVSDCSDTAVAR